MAGFRTPTTVAATALDGVSICPLAPHEDDRGTFTELYRHEWGLSEGLERWELVQLATAAPRPLNASLLIVLDGTVRLEVGGGVLELAGDQPAVVIVAPGASAVLRAVDGPALVTRASR